MTTRKLALLLVPALVLPACVTSTTTSRTWGEPYGGGWVRHGRVESIREHVTRHEGNPAGGAVAGAIIGGLLGSTIGGHHHHGYYRGNPAGALMGAVGGAMVGAAASQGASEDRTYEVFVRFEDGGLETFVYRGWPPFQVGEGVSLTPEGLVRW